MSSPLDTILRQIPAPAVAVSGGVDSLTLGAVAALLHPDVHIWHAVSPAVPAEATARVKTMARERGWQLTIIDAGEFADLNYRHNPVNRCYYCKSNLYGSIRARTERPILSGANLDDLGEYRPGLDAARDYAVRHPYIEAGMDKGAVRALARALGLGEVAQLPAAPCLASRVETGIYIEPSTLALVHRIERMVGERLKPKTVRCRIRAAALVIELDAASLAALAAETRQDLETCIKREVLGTPQQPIRFEEYRSGSAFLVA